MRRKHIFSAGIILVLGLVLLGATPRELGKLHLVVERSSGNVLQMGISEGSVVVEDSGTQELVIINAEKPTHLSENHFRFVDGKLVDMTSEQKSQIDSLVDTKKEDAEVARLKVIMARDPAGFRTVLGL